MAQYEVNTDRLRAVAGELQSVQQRLGGVAGELAKIQISRFLQINSSVLLSMRIADCNLAVLNHTMNLGKLARGLDAIADIYEQHEKSALDHAEGGAGTGGTAENADPTAGMTYEEILEYRAENAVDENTRRLYERYRDRVDINNDSYDGTAHYNNFRNEINYNAEDDATNPRGPGCTYYHEIGHLIDDQSDWNSTTSTDWSYDFYDCLQADVDNWLRNCMRENGYTSIDQAYADLSAWLMQDPNMKNGVSDLVNGLTEGRSCGRWGHDDDYYDSKSIPREAFAHFFEAGMCSDPTKLNYIREIFPSAYREFQDMIEDELDS